MQWYNLATDCSDSRPQLYSRHYYSPTDGSVNRWICTGQFLRTVSAVRITFLHNILCEANISCILLKIE